MIKRHPFFGVVSLSQSHPERDFSQQPVPVLIDVLDLIHFLVNNIAGHSTGLQFIHLLVNQIRDGFVEILDEVFDHFRDHLIGLLFILTFIGQILLGIS